MGVDGWRALNQLERGHRWVVSDELKARQQIREVKLETPVYDTHNQLVVKNRFRDTVPLPNTVA